MGIDAQRAWNARHKGRGYSKECLVSSFELEPAHIRIRRKIGRARHVISSRAIAPKNIGRVKDSRIHLCALACIHTRDGAILRAL